METWKRAGGFFGKYYEVSDQGRVRRRDTLDLLVGGMSSSQYRCVVLSRDGKQRTHDVHVLVCTAFHGAKPKRRLERGRWEVRHINGDRLDNRAANLAWGPSKANGEDRVRHGTAARGEDGGRAKLTEERVVAMRRAWNAGRGLQEIADEYGICLSQTHNIVSGAQWSHVVVPFEDEWRPIGVPGYEAYTIHREGRLRRRTTAGYWRTVKGEVTGGVTLLHADGSRHRFNIHELVAAVFVVTGSI